MTWILKSAFNAGAAGLGGGFAQNSQVVGTGTGIANPGPGNCDHYLNYLDYYY